MESEIETWVRIPDYENYYVISNFGNVRSILRKIIRSNGTYQVFKPKDISVSISSNGYPSVSLTKNGKSRMYNIHSLLGLAFIDKDYLKKKLVINHIDGNKLNNNLKNLEIVSSSINNIHAKDLGLNKNRGETSSKTNLTNTIVLEIRELVKNGVMYKEIAKKYNITIGCIKSISIRKNWKHI